VQKRHGIQFYKHVRLLFFMEMCSRRPGGRAGSAAFRRATARRASSKEGACRPPRPEPQPEGPQASRAREPSPPGRS